MSIFFECAMLVQNNENSNDMNSVVFFEGKK